MGPEHRCSCTVSRQFEKMQGVDLGHVHCCQKVHEHKLINMHDERGKSSQHRLMYMLTHSSCTPVCKLIEDLGRNVYREKQCKNQLHCQDSCIRQGYWQVVAVFLSSQVAVVLFKCAKIVAVGGGHTARRIDPIRSHWPAQRSFPKVFPSHHVNLKSLSPQHILRPSDPPPAKHQALPCLLRPMRGESSCETRAVCTRPRPFKSSYAS